MALEHALISKLPLLVLFIDCEKAYDSTCHDHLLVALDNVGLRNRAIKAIINSAIFLAKRYVCIPGYNEDGREGHFWTDERGLLQGHKWSPWLYLVDQNDMQEYVRQHVQNVPGAGFLMNLTKLHVTFFADDSKWYATTIPGILAVIAALEGYMRQATRRANVSKTKLMAFNWPRNQRNELNNLSLQGERIDVVDWFQYLGNAVSARMQTTVLGLRNPGYEEHQWSRAMRLLPVFFTSLGFSDIGARFRRQLITCIMSALEYGCGVYGIRRTVKWERLLKQLACRTLGLPANCAVPACTVLFELGLTTAYARVHMHRLRLFTTICNAGNGTNSRILEIWNAHSMNYAVNPHPAMWRARVLESLTWVGKAHCIDAGWDINQEGSVKDAIMAAATRDAHADIAAYPSLTPGYRDVVRDGYLTLQWYTVHQRADVVEAWARLRTGQTVLYERTRRFGPNAIADRAMRLCPFCNAECESSRHFLIRCPRWQVQRAEAEGRVLGSDRVSAFFKHAAGTISERPDTWYAILLCGHLPPAFGDDYNRPHGQLVFNNDAVARRVLADRTAILSLLGTHILRWYNERREHEPT
jgi:hypothetical protein